MLDFNKKLRCLASLFLIYTLASCLPSTEDSIASFNKRYAPEYQLSKTHLFVNWQGDAKYGVEPLNLKIPVAYLSDAVNEKNEFKTVIWALKPMEKGKIDKIYLALRRSNGQPVPDVYPKKTNDPEITKTQKEIYSDQYVVTIDHKLTIDPLFNKKSSVSYLNDEVFRGDDQEGLEHYIEMRCYDIQYLQTRAKDFSGQDDSQEILERLANKTSRDFTPPNCLASFNTEYWISPASVPDSKAVRIVYATAMTGYEIGFLYKNHMVILTPRESPEKMVKNWQRYQQQVTQVLDSFIVQ